MATNRIQIKERAIGLAMNAITFSDWKVDRNWKMSFYKSLFFFMELPIIKNYSFIKLRTLFSF